MAFGQRNAFAEFSDNDSTGDFADVITGIRRMGSRRRKKKTKRSHPRKSRARRKTRKHRKASGKKRMSRKGKRPYPYWLKKYMFKKR